MKTLWVRELHKYKKSYLVDLLGGGECGQKLLNKLRLSNIVRKVRDNEDRTDEVLPEDLTDIVLDDTDIVTFNFVGIVMIGDCVLRCYPKYEEGGPVAADEKPSKEFSGKFNNAMAAIRKYNKMIQQNINAIDYKGDSDISHLSIILELLQHYYKNGFYIKPQGLDELNGEGEINWGRTIHETEAIIVNKKPFYPDMYTAITQWDEMDYFHQLHRCIISECFKLLKDAELKEVLGQSGNLNCEKRLKDFGSNEQIVRKLKKELKVQFVTWKKVVLNLMIAYVTRIGAKRKNTQVLFYGTNSMNLIWERACKDIFGDMLDKNISDLSILPEDRRDDFISANEDMKLIDVIDKPVWTVFEKGKSISKDTLIPDTIVINRQNDKLWFNIYDAKYYHVLTTNSNISQQPGIESITKQYLYHQAYKDFMKHFGIEDITNVFLFPTDKASKRFGKVSLSFLHDITNQDIEAVSLNADEVWKIYVSNDMKELNEFIDGRTDQGPAQPEHGQD